MKLNLVRYQRAYVDFFEDEMVLEGYDWRKIMDIYLFQGKNPLINCVVADCKDLAECHSKLYHADKRQWDIR